VKRATSVSEFGTPGLQLAAFVHRPLPGSCQSFVVSCASVETAVKATRHPATKRSRAFIRPSCFIAVVSFLKSQHRC
jgi:hypothetical protein